MSISSKQLRSIDAPGSSESAVPDWQGHTRCQKVPAIPSVPRLQLDAPNCLTRGPPFCYVPPALQTSGFEADRAAPLCGSGAYGSVRRLRHVGTGQPFALKVVEKQPLQIRNMLPQLSREIGIQSALKHRHLLRLLSKLGRVTSGGLSMKPTTLLLFRFLGILTRLWCLRGPLVEQIRVKGLFRVPARIVEDDSYVYMLLEFCGAGTMRFLGFLGGSQKTKGKVRIPNKGRRSFEGFQ